MTSMADSVSSRLTRHFFSSLFDFGFLSDAGVQSFTRLILGVYGVFLALGLLLVRIFMAKYGALMDGVSPERYVAAVIAANPDAVASYKAGRVQAIGALVGQVMKLTRGTANPKVVHALVQRQLDA